MFKKLCNWCFSINFHPCRVVVRRWRMAPIAWDTASECDVSSRWQPVPATELVTLSMLTELWAPTPTYTSKQRLYSANTTILIKNMLEVDNFAKNTKYMFKCLLFSLCAQCGNRRGSEARRRRRRDRDTKEVDGMGMGKGYPPPQPIRWSGPGESPAESGTELRPKTGFDAFWALKRFMRWQEKFSIFL